MLKDELEYFTNQCYKEAKRVSMLDYETGRETTINMGEMILRFIYEVRILVERYS